MSIHVFILISEIIPLILLFFNIIMFSVSLSLHKHPETENVSVYFFGITNEDIVKMTEEHLKTFLKRFARISITAFLAAQVAMIVYKIIGFSLLAMMILFAVQVLTAVIWGLFIGRLTRKIRTEFHELA